MAGAGEQRVHVLQQRRHHQLIVVAEKQVEDLAAQRLDAHRLGRQDVLDVLGKNPLHDRAHSSSSTPTTIDDRPMKRIWPSFICVSLRNVSRQRLGARKGSTPSRISSRATAMSKVAPMAHFLAGWGLPIESLK